MPAAAPSGPTGLIQLTYARDRSSWERPAFALVFVTLLFAHVWFATRNLTSGFLAGHEFRQAQTALTCYYIDRENNFSPRYETPVLGKPWVSNPLEFPLYQWSVVLLSRATGLPHIPAARVISLACFYLTLPALYLLLARFTLPPARRLLVLALVLACPAYIFYSRAFLIESMALLASAWFLLGFVRAMDTRHWPWLLLAILAGTVAGLVKNTTFAVWLLPALGYTIAQIIAKARGENGWRQLAATAAWSIGAVAIPLVLLAWWLAFTDAIKAAHPSASFLTTWSLSHGNLGLLNLAARVSPANWSRLLHHWGEAIMAPWLLGAVALVGAGFPSIHRRPLLLLASVFIGAQLVFPSVYSMHDYYFYAVAVFGLGALGFALFAILDSALPLPLRVLPLIVPFAALISNYWLSYRVEQLTPGDGGTGLTLALRAYTPPESVLIIGGADWSASIPYYAQRRALMIRNGLEDERDYLDRAFDSISDENVAALVLVGTQRTNRRLLAQARARFSFDDHPTFSHSTADVYLSPLLRHDVATRILYADHYDQITTALTASTTLSGPSEEGSLSPAESHRAFPVISPAPERYRIVQGYSLQARDSGLVVSVSPESDLWLPPESGVSHVGAVFGILPAAYERKGDHTTGVIFIVGAETPDGTRRELFRRVLDPVKNPADRGDQNCSIACDLRPKERLVFSTRANGSPSYGWAYLAHLDAH